MGLRKFEGMKIEEAPPEVIPKCPHCEEELHCLWIKTMGLGWIEQKQVILCPHCQAFLGYGSFSWS